MRAIPLRRLTDAQRAAIVQWGAALPFGLRVGSFRTDFGEGPCIEGDDPSELVCIVDRHGDAICLLMIPEAAELGAITLTYPNGREELFPSVEDALDAILACERDFFDQSASRAA